MLKRRVEHRTKDEIELLIAAINREFFKKKGVRIELDDGHFMTIREVRDKGLEYAIVFSDNRLVWRKYKQLRDELEIVLDNKNNKVFDEDARELCQNYFYV